MTNNNPSTFPFSFCGKSTRAHQCNGAKTVQDVHVALTDDVCSPITPSIATSSWSAPFHHCPQLLFREVSGFACHYFQCISSPVDLILQDLTFPSSALSSPDLVHCLESAKHTHGLRLTRLVCGEAQESDPRITRDLQHISLSFLSLFLTEAILL